MHSETESGDYFAKGYNQGVQDERMDVLFLLRNSLGRENAELLRLVLKIIEEGRHSREVT